jgi:hypothetical protein
MSDISMIRREKIVHGLFILTLVYTNKVNILLEREISVAFKMLSYDHFKPFLCLFITTKTIIISGHRTSIFILIQCNNPLLFVFP